MTAFLPPSLLALFAARPPIPYMPLPEKRNLPPLSGLAQFVSQFEDPAVNPPGPGRNPFETKKERKKAKAVEKITKHKQVLEEKVKEWDPNKDTKATGDPYRTLFVAKISYNTSDYKLKKEFEVFGPIKKIRIITDQKGKPRGYAFIEFEKERDMRAAYEQADGRKIDGNRVLVDIERGRTIRGWRPRKYGGGLGTTRATPEEREQMRRERDQSHDRRGDRGGDRDRPSSSRYGDSRGGDSRGGDSRGGDRRERDRRPRSRSPRDRDRRRSRSRDRGERKRSRSRDERERAGGYDRGDKRARPMDNTAGRPQEFAPMY